MEFRVTSITEAGQGRVNVTLSEAAQPVPVGYGVISGPSSLNLNLSADDAADYTIGKVYDLNLKAK